jgi:hypothetical protein
MKYNFFKIYINYSLERKKEKKKDQNHQEILPASGCSMRSRNERKWFSVQVKIEI